jgi:hypothetical protein
MNDTVEKALKRIAENDPTYTHSRELRPSPPLPLPLSLSPSHTHTHRSLYTAQPSWRQTTASALRVRLP